MFSIFEIIRGDCSEEADSPQIPVVLLPVHGANVLKSLGFAPTRSDDEESILSWLLCIILTKSNIYNYNYQHKYIIQVLCLPQEQLITADT